MEYINLIYDFRTISRKPNIYKLMKFVKKINIDNKDESRRNINVIINQMTQGHVERDTNIMKRRET